MDDFPARLCPLCNGPSEDFSEFRHKRYLLCSECRGVFMDPDHRLDTDAEKRRYLEHNNDVLDAKYRKFVSPITSAVLQDFGSEARGLDFGAGTGPVITRVLQENGYDIRAYDPFFHNDPALLTESCDYIVCCEVIEHLYQPAEVFARLKNLLRPGGKLYCMTLLYDDSIDFSQWWYKKDPTHVFFYHPESLLWIQNVIGFSFLSVADGRLAVFTR